MKKLVTSLFVCTLCATCAPMENLKKAARKISSSNLLLHSSYSQSALEQSSNKLLQLHKLPEEFMLKKFFPRLMDTDWTDSLAAYEGLKMLYALGKTSKKLHGYVQTYLRTIEPQITAPYWETFDIKELDDEKLRIEVRKTVIATVEEKQKSTQRLSKLVLILLYMRNKQYDINEIFSDTNEQLHSEDKKHLYDHLCTLPLVQAVKKRRVSVVQLLLRAGINPQLRAWKPVYTNGVMTKEYYTAYDIVKKKIEKYKHDKQSKKYKKAVALKELLEAAEKHPKKYSSLLSS